MTNWVIPSKTFLVGEYVAIAGDSAIVLTTTPCFKVRCLSDKKLINIHSQSPAGRLWRDSKSDVGLSFEDPYQGLGGMGASTAQFIGVYKALYGSQFDPNHLMTCYHQYAWPNFGVKPSGYDLLAQTSSGCVVLDSNQKMLKTCHWPFDGLSFALVHTHKKLATHEHLGQLVLPENLSKLKEASADVVNRFFQADESAFIRGVTQFGDLLDEYGLVAHHTRQLIQTWSKWPEVLCIKGCGALGADILLVISQKKHFNALIDKIKRHGHQIIATEDMLYQEKKQSVV